MPHFCLIYPENFELKAQEMIPTLDFAYENTTKTLMYKPKPVPIILHNYNTESNAITAWAPKRIDMFTCPPQDSYAQEWLSQLILHEYRHVIQIDRTNQGFTKVLSWLTGEQGTAAVNGLFVPSWFMEGDAVCAETALSRSGRGRVPAFEMPLRTQVMQKGAFTYDKASLGSFKTYVPDQYMLGYSLVANVRRKYGYQAWVSGLDEVARKPFIVTPFNHGLKKATGNGKENLYRSTMFEMNSMWNYQDIMTPKTSFKQLSPIENTTYSNYKFPYYINDSVVIAEYTCLDDITRFVILSHGESRKIVATPGYLSTENYSITRKTNQGNQSFQSISEPEAKQLLVWTETIDDPRWGERKYSVIRLFDMSSGKTRDLTTKSRYFAPSVSPDGHLLAAIAVDPESHSSIVLINTETSKITDTIITSKTDFYMTPSWSENGDCIVFVKLDCKGKCISVCNLLNKKVSVIVPPTYVEISNPVFAGGYILFNGSYSGIENIYAADTVNSEIYQVTSAAFGACNADLSPDGSKIVYSNYTSAGYSLVETAFDPTTWKPLTEIRDFSPSLYKYLVKEENCLLDLPKESLAVYNSQPYNKMTHIFNFHSWAPAYINYMENENGAGVSIMSQNDLSTATTIIGYKYDMAENTGKATLDFSWKAWYPMIDIKSSYGARTAYTDSAIRYNFNEAIISGGLTLPLIFTGGKYYKGFQLQAFSSWINITDNTSPIEDKLTGTIHSLGYSLFVYRYIKQSYKDIYPRWGQAITLTYRHSPFGDNDLGSIASAESRFYFPGIGLHHGIRVDFNWQQINSGSYSYSNQINLPRGYNNVFDHTLTCFALNYKFPFLYPDFALGPLVYFKRVKANFFYDAGKGTTHGVSRKIESTGIEITSDLHLVRFVFPFDIGVRLGYLPIEKENFVNFLFSVNL